MGSQATILVVEDETELADEYANVLSEYDVRTAYSGEAALEAFDSSVDVVLLDRRMPGLSGDEVLATISEKNTDCRIVMVTAVEPDIDIVEMEFDEYLVKPVSTETLLSVVEQMVARNDHDERLQEMFAVASKLATLESKLELQQLNRSKEYSTLRNRFDELSQQIDRTDEDMYHEATREKIQALLKDSG